MPFPVADLAIVTACIFGLYFAARLIVSTSAAFARKLGVSDLIIGLTIVAIGTSMPEFAVTVRAALHHEIEIALGNVIGSNIINLGFILGGVAILAAVPVTRKLATRDGVMLILTALLLVYFFWDHHFVWWEGGILFLVMVGYITSLIAQNDLILSIPPIHEFNYRDIPWFIFGCILIVGCSNLFVASALNIADFLGLTSWVMGVTFVALGTSLPEIVTSGVAIKDGRPEISAGNLIGSNLFNLLGVMGLAGLLDPVRDMYLEQFLVESSWMLLLLMVTVVFMMFTGWEISRREGVFLFLIAAVSWVINFSDFTVLGIF
ncbi:MAG: sodium:calcium antiporter [Chloroflexota bacterium]